MRGALRLTGQTGGPAGTFGAAILKIVSASSPSRGRLGKVSTPVIVLGSLFAALGLTAFADPDAKANPGNPRDHAHLAEHEDLTDLRVLDWALWNVSKYYVEPERVDPHRMTMAGLEALEATIPEVLVEPIGKGDRVRVRVGTAEKEFDAEVDALWSVGPHLREVFRFVAENAELTTEEQREAEYAMVEGLLHTLDPHTSLLRPEAFDDMKASTKGSFGGLGIEVGVRDGKITVIRVLPNNPAAKVGMEAGDIIVQIDDESAVAMGIDEAVSRLRGAPGTNVAIHVRREGLDKPKKLTITRDVIKLDSVTGDILPGVDKDGNPVKVGLIQIPRNFAAPTAKEMRAKLDEFEAAGVDGIVLDMRDNPGGLLSAAVDVADAFLSSGPIVATVGNASPRDESLANSRYDFRDVPIAVLVDQGSASATEIVAGALRNRDRAVIMGRRTFGKGSVQVLHDRRVGDRELALKLTIAQYLTPGDVSIQSVGVSPDIETIPVWIGEEYAAFYGRERFDRIREESLASHLMNGRAKPQPIAAGPLYYLSQGSLGDRSDDDKKRLDLVEDADKRAEMLLRDPEIRMARDLVIWAPSSKRSDILAQVDGFVGGQEKIEEDRIIRSLGMRGVDWTPGPKPTTGTPQLRAQLSMDKKDNVIKGGDSGVLTVTVTNDGDAPAYQVRALSDSDYGYFDERELFFGKIDPGQTRKATLKLSVSEHELSRTDRIDFLLHSQHAAPIAKSSQSHIDVSAQGLARPQFAYGYQIIDDPSFGENISGNGDGLLQKGERVRVRIDVKNTGVGPALDTWVNLRNLEGDTVFVHEGRFKVGKLNPGESTHAELDLELRKAPDDGKAEIQLTVSDNKIGEFLGERLAFPVLDAPFTFKAEDTGISITRDVQLYAAPAGDRHVVATAAPGARFVALGRGGDWVKIRLDKDQFAFVSADAVSPGKKPRRPGPFDQALIVSPPQITLTGVDTQTEGETVSLSGTAADVDGVRDVYITVANPSRDLFGNREKVFYQAAPGGKGGKLEFSAEVPLTPGNNLIEIHARENDEVIALRRIWVLRTSGLAEARAADREYNSDHNLSVDTFSK